jgi:hypothetical protein
MVPFTIFQRLSSLGSGGGVNAGTIPPDSADTPFSPSCRCTVNERLKATAEIEMSALARRRKETTAHI